MIIQLTIPWTMARACLVDAFNPAAFGLSHVDSPFRCAMLSAPWLSRTNNIFPRNAKKNNSHIIYIAPETLFVVQIYLTNFHCSHYVSHSHSNLI